MTPVERYEAGINLLRSTNCSEGWELYDLHPSRPVDRLPLPRWDGGPCPTLVIMAEQGFGDMLQFLRFIPRLEFTGDIVVAVHDELYPVCATSHLFSGCRVMRRSEARIHRWPDDTRWERLLSLPVHLNTVTIDRQESFLPVPPPPPRLPNTDAGILTVGVAWRSTHRRDGPNRSLPASLLRQLAVPRRTRLVSLHRHTSIARPHPDLIQPPIRNFTDTAAVIGQCDLVVTSDTVTAHLAPGLGIPTTVLLLHEPDWRWGTRERPINWYAHAELLFQPEPGDWQSVISTIRTRLEEGS
jgi:ADP-heptose:LPS heptosyltransferase